MATNPATQAALSARSLRPLTPTEMAWGVTALDDAFSIVSTRVPSVPSRLDANPAPSFINVVVQIQCAMVLRVLNNPDGKLQETIDDYTYRLDQAVSTGALYLSDAEETLLGAGAGSATAFTIKPAGTAPDVVWTPTQMRSF